MIVLGILFMRKLALMACCVGLSGASWSSQQCDGVVSFDNFWECFDRFEQADKWKPENPPIDGDHFNQVNWCLGDYNVSEIIPNECHGPLYLDSLKKFSMSFANNTECRDEVFLQPNSMPLIVQSLLDKAPEAFDDTAGTHEFDLCAANKNLQQADVDSRRKMFLDGISCINWMYNPPKTTEILLNALAIEHDYKLKEEHKTLKQRIFWAKNELQSKKGRKSSGCFQFEFFADVLTQWLAAFEASAPFFGFVDQCDLSLPITKSLCEKSPEYNATISQLLWLGEQIKGRLQEQRQKWSVPMKQIVKRVLRPSLRRSYLNLEKLGITGDGKNGVSSLERRYGLNKVKSAISWIIEPIKKFETNKEELEKMEL